MHTLSSFWSCEVNFIRYIGSCLNNFKTCSWFTWATDTPIHKLMLQFLKWNHRNMHKYWEIHLVSMTIEFFLKSCVSWSHHVNKLWLLCFCQHYGSFFITCLNSLLTGMDINLVPWFAHLDQYECSVSV